MDALMLIEDGECCTFITSSMTIDRSIPGARLTKFGWMVSQKQRYRGVPDNVERVCENANFLPRISEIPAWLNIMGLS